MPTISRRRHRNRSPHRGSEAINTELHDAQDVHQIVNNALNLVAQLNQLQIDNRKTIRAINNALLGILAMYLIMVGLISNYVIIMILYTLFDNIRSKGIALHAPLSVFIINTVLPLSAKYAFYTPTFLQISMDNAVIVGTISNIITVELIERYYGRIYRQ